MVLPTDSRMGLDGLSHSPTTAECTMTIAATASIMPLCHRVT